MDTQLSFVGGHFIDLQKIGDDSIIVDAGACIGEFIEALHRHEQGMKCKIMALECDRDNIKTLKEKNYYNVTIYPKALIGNNSDGKIIFYQYLGLPHSGNVGFIKKYLLNHKDFRGMLKYEVEILRINDIFSALNVDRINYMKMNIEGAERDVLGMMTKKTASKIDHVSVSIHANFLPGISYSTITERLVELGFDAWKAGDREIYGIFNSKKRDLC